MCSNIRAIVVWAWAHRSVGAYLELLDELDPGWKVEGEVDVALRHRQLGGGGAEDQHPPFVKPFPEEEQTTEPREVDQPKDKGASASAAEAQRRRTFYVRWGKQENAQDTTRSKTEVARTAAPSSQYLRAHSTYCLTLSTLSRSETCGCRDTKR